MDVLVAVFGNSEVNLTVHSEDGRLKALPEQ